MEWVFSSSSSSPSLYLFGKCVWVYGIAASSGPLLIVSNSYYSLFSLTHSLNFVFLFLILFVLKNVRVMKMCGCRVTIVILCFCFNFTSSSSFFGNKSNPLDLFSVSFWTPLIKRVFDTHIRAHNKAWIRRILSVWMQSKIVACVAIADHFTYNFFVHLCHWKSFVLLLPGAVCVIFVWKTTNNLNKQPTNRRGEKNVG